MIRNKREHNFSNVDVPMVLVTMVTSLELLTFYLMFLLEMQEDFMNLEKSSLGNTIGYHEPGKVFSCSFMNTNPFLTEGTMRISLRII